MGKIENSKMSDLLTLEDKETVADQLEELIIKANTAYDALEKGFAFNEENLIDDDVYDMYKSMLRQLRPDSEALKCLWSSDSPDYHPDTDLELFKSTHPLLSIRTIKTMNDADLMSFRGSLPNPYGTEFIASMKENGFGISIHGKDGKILKACSRGGSARGRISGGKDYTDIIKAKFGDFIPGLKDCGIFDIRAELLLPFSNLATARKYNPNIKSAFTGVSSMSRGSATIMEYRLLDVVCYNIFTTNKTFTSLSEKFDFLTNCGFLVPIFCCGVLSKDTFDADIKDVMDYMAEQQAGYDYYTDGVVLSVDNIAQFEAMGTTDVCTLGNVALKMGVWEQLPYTAKVKKIKWTKGKSVRTPVAVIEPTLTANGDTVCNVPLYSPCYILLAEAYPGNQITFKFGGESGVVPCMPDGTLLTDIAYKNILKEVKRAVTDLGISE